MQIERWAQEVVVPFEKDDTEEIAAIIDELPC
jgi:hypothetical protein